MIKRITRFETRHYTDNGQVVAYVYWQDGSDHEGRTEGDPNSLHMAALKDRAKREGAEVVETKW